MLLRTFLNTAPAAALIANAAEAATSLVYYFISVFALAHRSVLSVQRTVDY